jgi:hypothetical protein
VDLPASPSARGKAVHVTNVYFVWAILCGRLCMGDFVWAIFGWRFIWATLYGRLLVGDLYGRLLLGDFCWWDHVLPHESYNSFLIALKLLKRLRMNNYLNCMTYVKFY